MKYFQIFKKIFPFFGLGAFLIFVDRQLFGLFANIGWWLLVAVILSRPLFQVLPRLSFLRYVVMLRRELGILSACFLLAHGVGFFLNTGFSPLDPKLWNFTEFVAWGLLGVIIAIPLLLTSNNLSMRILGSKWKMLQRLSYVMFIAGAIHFSMASGGDRIIIIPIVVIWIIFWMLANRKIVLWKVK